MDEIRRIELENKAVSVAETQNELNILTCKDKNWGQLPLHWDLCILSESCGEGIGSTDFEHWKPSKEDLENLKVEMVDTGHFIASYIIAKENPIYCAKFFTHVFNTMEVSLNGSTINNFNLNNWKFSLKNFVLKFLTIDMNGCNIWVDAELKDLAEKFGYLLLKSGLNVDEFSRRYFIKNTLNLCRQHLGLADGDYVKVYQGQEDNVHIERIAQEIEARDGDLHKELMGAFKEWYMHGPHEEAN